MPSSFWKGAISFGLLNIPVSLQTAEKGEELHFTQLDRKNLARIRYKRVNERTGKEVPYSQIAKGYEYEKGRFVIITDEDIKAANPRATQTIEIQDFVNLASIDPTLFEKPYFIVPSKQGEKGYALLRDAMADEKTVAIASVVLRTKQHLAAVMPKGDYLLLELMRFSHQVLDVKDADYLTDAARKATYSPKELKMAEALMEDMKAPWKPSQYRDTFYQDLRKRIEKKIKGGLVESLESESRSRRTRSESGTMIDLLPLLQQSLHGKKKKAS